MAKRVPSHCLPPHPDLLDFHLQYCVMEHMHGSAEYKEDLMIQIQITTSLLPLFAQDPTRLAEMADMLLAIHQCECRS